MVPSMEAPYDEVAARVEHIPINLALVSISRHNFLDNVHAIVAQLLKPDAAFFSITLNELDVLLVVDEEAGHAFRQRHPTQQQHEHTDKSQTEETTLQLDLVSNGVKISRLQWTALSLDVSRSPARLCKISDAMQTAHIPMIYQSAMNCDYLFVPGAHLQKALSILEEEVGLIVSEDERPDRYPGNRWDKSRSRPPKRRSRRSHDVPSNSPSSSSTSSSDSFSSKQRGRPKTQKASASSPMPPMSILPHKIAFHGLNSGLNGDALLKIVKMIGWPDSLLPKRPKHLSPDLQFGSYENRAPARFPHQLPLNGTGPPRRPGFSTRHSADAQSFKTQHGLRHSDTSPPTNGILIPPRQVPVTSRSRSTSYPNVLPDFYQQRATGNHTTVLPPPAEHPFPDDDPKPSPESPPLSQSQLHTQTLPFLSLTHRMRDPGDTEVSIMTRGTLLARLFESSMLIGGSGDIAASDEEREEIAYMRRGRRDSTMAGLDEGFKCLQADLSSVKIEEHARLLSYMVETLDSHSIKHHLARTVDAIDILVPYSQAKRAHAILQGASGA